MQVKNIYLLLALLFCFFLRVNAQKTDYSKGLLYFASYESSEDDLVKKNPYIIGAVRTIKWANIEKKDGVYDWSSIDQFIASWAKYKKKVVLRMQWVTSGYWKDPMSKTPTPEWVWENGAKYAFHAPSQTEIPLFWDPIYQHYALRFLSKIAERYDNNPNILFIDITPGAETNPYRFRSINKKDPDFKKVFMNIESSNGCKYSEDLWKETVLEWLPKASGLFKKLPTEVALNKGSLFDNNNFELFGNRAVECGMYIGQNGLSGNRYSEKESAKVQLLSSWAKKTKIFFEMVGATSKDVGSLKEIMDAAFRGKCSYLNVYAKDVLKGTKGFPEYDNTYEEALEYGNSLLKESY